MEGRFRRAIDELPRVFEMSGEFFSQHDIGTPDRETIDLVLEEIFTNAVRHGARGLEDVVLSLDKRGDDVTVALTDLDAEPFDPSKQPVPPLDAPIEKRQPGGLGIHLVRRLSDRIEYEYRDRTSTVTVHRKLG